VLTGLLILLLLVVALLAIPVTLTYWLSWKQTFSGGLKVRWAFGLVRVGVTSADAQSRSVEQQAAQAKAGRSNRASGTKPNVLAAMRRESFRRRMLRFVTDVWSAIRKQNVNVLIRLGLGDPAETGRLWAVIGPLAGFLTRGQDVRIAMVPDFVDSTFELDSDGTLRVVPLQLTGLALLLLLSPSFWHGIIAMRINA